MRDRGFGCIGQESSRDRTWIVDIRVKWLVKGIRGPDSPNDKIAIGNVKAFLTDGRSKLGQLVRGVLLTAGMVLLTKQFRSPFLKASRVKNCWR